MNKQNSYADLIAERENLENMLARQQHLIRADIYRLKASVQPALTVLEQVGNITKSAGQSSLFRNGIGLAAGLLLGNKLLRKTNPVVKFGLPIAWQLIKSTLFRSKK